MPVGTHSSLEAARSDAAGCRRCPLWEPATQTVFGQGSPRSRVMLVGEQPGNEEDLEGEPFVGPAGRVLDDALREAGIDRGSAYVTNVVKHFKFRQRGKARIHQRPNRSEVSACRPWLDAELAIVQPEILMLLGATAAQAVLGPSFRVTRHRGEWLDCDLAPLVTATVHPSQVLRVASEDRRSAFSALVEDLELVAGALG